MNWNLTLLVIIIFIIIIFFTSQQRFKNKIFCTFHRPNNTKIEKWVPMTARAVIFDGGKYGVGQYEIDSECIELQWYERGINKLFPTLIPTLEFWWNTPMPMNPKTKLTSWHTPEVRYHAWQEHDHNAYAKATASVSGMKQNKLFTVVIPILIIAVVIFSGLFMWYNMQGLKGQLNQIQASGQQAKLK